MNTYNMPKHGWTCYHCGETFTTPGSAKDHFGGDPLSLAACQIKAGPERGLLMSLRKAEEEIWRLRNDEDTITRSLIKANYEQQERHSSALQSAGELGYMRGLRDAKLETTQ